MKKQPHLHIVTVPITEDGRLSAKEIIGNKKQMQERQDRYAELMKPFRTRTRNQKYRHQTRRVKQADLEFR